MLRISWTKRISNEKILDMVGLKKELIMNIRKRILRFVGHVERNSGLGKLVLEGKVNNTRLRGRKR